MPTYNKSLRCAAMWLAALVAGCGGGGGGGAPAPSAPPPPPPPASNWIAGSFLPAASHAGRCVNPRSGTDPATALPYSDIQGATLDENNWLRSWSNDLYLWYDEIVDRDPGLHSTADYFRLLKTPEVTQSGNSKDRFHFTYPTAEWRNLSQSGVEAGYGVLWAVVASLPPRHIVVAYTEPGSPARDAGAAFARGAVVQRIDGVDAVNSNTQADVDVILAGLYPESVGERHTFVLRDSSSGVERPVALTSTAVTKTPVPVSQVLAANQRHVGYLLFNDHILTAEQQLVTAIEQMQAANVDDLVVDLRYNGGGYLFLASQLAYMIAGPARTSGQTFELLQFNDKHASIDPVTGQPLAPLPFLDTTRSGQPLPALSLPRVYVLTGGTTCSASESIINGLRGVGVEVVQIGSTTCGKPYGFYPQDNCGTTYFSIQFKGINAAGFGDYTDGFSPENRGTGTKLPGCSIADDFGAELGSVDEDRLKLALLHSGGAGTCPAPTGEKPSFTKPLNGAAAEPDVLVRKPPWLMNRIVEGA